MKALYEKLRDKENTFYITLNRHNQCLPHFHAMFEIVTVIEGEQEIRVNDESLILKENWIALSDSYDIHAYKPSEALSTVITIPKSYLSDYSRLKGEKKLKTNFIYSPDVSMQIRTYAEMIHKETNPLKIKGYVNLLLAACAELAGFTFNREVKNDDMVYEILNFIENNYLHELTLNTIAEKFNYCPTHFSRLFHRLFGISLSEHINLLRLARLFTLKDENTNLKLCDLAFECGFNSMPTFYRAFSKQFGVSPQKYFKDFK